MAELGKPSVEMEIAGKSRVFPTLGSLIRTEAVAQLRQVKSQAFQGTIAGFSQNQETLNSSSSVREAISQFLRSVVIDDWEVKDWLARASDGKMFLISRSLRKHDPKITRDEIESILDNMTEEQIDAVSRNCFVGVFRGDTLYQSILFPELLGAENPETPSAE